MLALKVTATAAVGATDGAVGLDEGDTDGDALGLTLGSIVGLALGLCDGLVLGETLGENVGASVLSQQSLSWHRGAPSDNEHPGRSCTTQRFRCNRVFHELSTG